MRSYASRALRRAVLLLAAASGFAMCQAQAVTDRIPVVLSTDVGNEIDDQWAVTYLLVQPRFEVVGILSAHAPSLPAPAAHSSYRLLVHIVEDRLGLKVHPPLLEGSSLPLEDEKTPRASAATQFLIERSKGYSKAKPLMVLMIGAATDVASAILFDPSIVERIRVVQMGFNNEAGGDEYNILNDVAAARVILNSAVPLAIGPGDICRRHLSLTYEQAHRLIAGHGPIGGWLWAEFEDWYYREVKPLRVDDFSKSWVIWDNITLAYVLGMTQQHDLPRRRLTPKLTFESGATDRTVTWITQIDQDRMWKDFLEQLDRFQSTHVVPSP